MVTGDGPPPVGDLRPARDWSPPVGLIVLAWLGAVAAAGWCVLAWTGGADGPGRLLSTLAVVVLLGLATFGSRARPRLRADADGLTVGGLLRARHVPWPLVTQVRVLPVRRFGVTGALLEIDTMTADGDEQLTVLGRLDLGVDPHEVLTHLQAHRPRQV